MFFIKIFGHFCVLLNYFYLTNRFSLRIVAIASKRQEQKILVGHKGEVLSVNWAVRKKVQETLFRIFRSLLFYQGSPDD